VVFVTPEGEAATKKKTKSHSSTTASKMVWKTWPLAELIEPTASPEETELFVKFVMKAIRPTTWQGRGGHGTVCYQEENKSLVIHQTSAIQTQVGCLFKAMVMLKAGAEKQAEKRAHSPACSTFEGVMPAAYPPMPPPMPCPAPKAQGAKQYGHF